MKPFIRVHAEPRNFLAWAEKVKKEMELSDTPQNEMFLHNIYAALFTGVTFVNDVYSVLHHNGLFYGGQQRLSIHRHDYAPCNSWSDFQQIKNELIGPEAEAVQVYPAESRLLDTDNVYHLFIVHEKIGFNFGRAVWKN